MWECYTDNSWGLGTPTTNGCCARRRSRFWWSRSLARSWEWDSERPLAPPILAGCSTMMRRPDQKMGLSENSVPHCTQWLMIIIPIKWLFHWGYTPFSDKPKWWQLALKMWGKQRHKVPMTRNGLYIPPCTTYIICVWWWLGHGLWCLWHCFSQRFFPWLGGMMIFCI